MTEEEARELDRKHRVNRRRRLLVLLSFVAAIVMGTGAWVAYQQLAANRVLPPPTSSITALPSPGNWPMYQRDPAHTGFVGAVGVTLRGELRWRFETQAPIRSSPAVVDGRVYLGTGDRRVVALDAGSGELLWERGVSGPVDSSPAMAGGLVFVGLRDGRVLALNEDNGKLRWQFATQGPVYSSPAVHLGELYVASSDGRLYALDAVTGEERWSFPTGDRITSSPAVGQDLVAITSHDRKLYVLDPRTGKQRLDYRTTASSGSPALDDRNVFVADAVGVVRAIDWRKGDAPFEGLMLRIRIQLAAWGLMDTVPQQEGYVWSVRQRGASFINAPAVARDNVFVASTRGHLWALSKGTGEKVWEFRAHEGFVASPSATGETIFAGDVGGTLYAIDATTGKSRWELNVGGPISSTPVIGDGLLYVGSLDGTLHAIE